MRNRGTFFANPVLEFTITIKRTTKLFMWLVAHFGVDASGANILQVQLAALDAATGAYIKMLDVPTPPGSFAAVWQDTVEPFICDKLTPGSVLATWGTWATDVGIPSHMERYKLTTVLTGFRTADIRTLFGAIQPVRVRTLSQLAQLFKASSFMNGLVEATRSVMQTSTTALESLEEVQARAEIMSGDWRADVTKYHLISVMMETLGYIETLKTPPTIRYSAARAISRLWTPLKLMQKQGPGAIIRVWAADTFVAADTLHTQFPTAQIAVLNMASSLQVGGGYLTGARSQEEDLCRRSNLVTALKSAEVEGVFPIPSECMMYSSSVTVLRGPRPSYKWLEKPFDVAVLTAAALRKPRLVEDKYTPQQRELMQRKIHLLLTVAAANNHRHLVLGAWGTGAYGNPITEVAELFRDALQMYGGAFDVVVFAVLGTHSLRVFEETLTPSE